MEQQVADGQTRGHVEGTNPAEGEPRERAPADDRFESLQAQVEMLADSFGELQSTLVQQRQPAPQQVEEDWDDEEPVTASKVRKAVKSAVSEAVSQSSQVNERQRWDQKAYDEFPTSDPKFERALKKTWKEMKADGYNLNHPRALYRACKETALVYGKSQKSKSQESKLERETEFTAEAPNASSPVARSSGSAKLAPLDHPEVRFYMMKEQDPKKVERWRSKVYEKEQRKNRRR